MQYDHYGLSFVLNCSPEQVGAKVKELEKVNRVRLTDRDKDILRIGLRERMKVRRRKEDARREEFMK